MTDKSISAELRLIADCVQVGFEVEDDVIPTIADKVESLERELADKDKRISELEAQVQQMTESIVKSISREPVDREKLIGDLKKQFKK